MLYFVLKYLHIIGACVLLGTGAGIAFFMVAVQRTGRPAAIAAVADIVVLADFVFTATAVVAQPVTGIALAHEVGYPLTEGWIVLSIILYVVTGLFWLPVVWMQMELRRLARDAVKSGTPLPPRYRRIYAIWFAFGFPAFAAVMAILWLMIARPEISWLSSVLLF